MRVPGERATSAARAAASRVAIAAVVLVIAVAAGCTRQVDKPVPRIGFLSSVPSGISAGLQEGLNELGHVEGSTIAVEWRWTKGDVERIPALATELVGLKPEVIVTTSPQPTAAVKAATSTIPVVFVAVGDPVGHGLVPRLDRPGGNLTGLASAVSMEFTGKMLERLRAVVPSAARVGVLLNPTSADHRNAMSLLPDAAARLGLSLVPIEAKSAGDLDDAFARATTARTGAIVVLGDPVTYVHGARIAELAARERLPALYFFRESVEAGGLMSYGPSLHDLGRRSAIYVDKLLKGARPADLPVEQPVKFDLVINRKTAAALGLAIPPAVLLQAEVIE